MADTTPNPLNNIHNSSVPSSVQKAEEEQKVFDIENNKTFSKHKHRVFVWSLYILWGLVILLFVVRLFHFILPHECEWLTREQVQSLDKFLFSGAIGGILGKYGFKFIQ